MSLTNCRTKNEYSILHFKALRQPGLPRDLCNGAIITHKDREGVLLIKFYKNNTVVLAISCLLKIQEQVPDTIFLWMFLFSICHC